MRWGPWPAMSTESQISAGGLCRFPGTSTTMVYCPEALDVTVAPDPALPGDNDTEAPDTGSPTVVRMTPEEPCMLGHFELSWVPNRRVTVH